MFPELLRTENLTIYSYGALISLGIIVVAVLVYRQAIKEEFDPAFALEALLVSIIAGFISSRALFIALNWEYYSNQPLLSVITDFDGLTYYGGFFGGWLSGFFWSRWRKVNYLYIADFFAPYLMLGSAFGRIGCFLGGCCYGKVSDVPWALPASAADSLIRHPVQLYDALGLVIIYFILTLLRPRKPFAGFVLISLFALYGMLRFITEFFRFEDSVWLGLTLAQLFSLGLIAFSLLLIAVILRIYAPNDQERLMPGEAGPEDG